MRAKFGLKADTRRSDVCIKVAHNHHYIVAWDFLERRAQLAVECIMRRAWGVERRRICTDNSESRVLGLKPGRHEASRNGIPGEKARPSKWREKYADTLAFEFVMARIMQGPRAAHERMVRFECAISRKVCLGDAAHRKVVIIKVFGQHTQL